MPFILGILFAAFTIFRSIQQSQGQSQFSCREVVFNCDCGVPGYVFQAFFKQCHYWLPPEQACTRYQNCLECESGVDSCISCPPNRYGRQCRGVCQCKENQICNRDTGQCEGKVPSTATSPSAASPAALCVPPEIKPPVQQKLVREQGILKAIEYSCPDPYSLSGNRRIICNNGKWDDSPPTCDSCSPPAISSPLQQQVELSQGSPTAIEYACPDNHVLQGPKRIICTSGKWDQSPPSCKPMGCPRPKEIPNGKIDRFFLPIGTTIGGGASGGRQVFQVGTIAVYICNPFYKLGSSRGRVRCTSAGQWAGDNLKCVHDCGISEFKVPNIINGTVTEPGNWPWQAGLADLNNYIFCGGSLITDSWVLTAAHCLVLDRRKLPNEIKVFLGKYRRNVKDDFVQERLVSQYEVHPRFTSTTLDNDIALILVDRPIQISKRTLPVCLTTESISNLNVDYGKGGLVTGWGKTETGEDSDVLRRANLTVISNNECSRRNSVGQALFVVTENMFCAGVPKGATDVCQGDSGGPMVFQYPGDGRWYVEGIVSWGVSKTCAVDGMYSGFTRVSRYLDWIDGYILNSPQNDALDRRLRP